MRFFILFATFCAMGTAADAQNPAPAPCMPWHYWKAEQIHGVWLARFTNPPAGLPATATLRLERHAEFSESLAGTVSRKLDPAGRPAKVGGHGAEAALAGDLDEGMLLLDESSDNISISGTWNGEMLKDSCGQAFEGVWKDTSKSAPPDAPGVPFTLRKLR